MEEFLSQGISHVIDTIVFSPIASFRKFPTPSHTIYVDDILIFCKGIKRNLMNLMKLFNDYSHSFGQHINPEKCFFFLGAMATRRFAEIRNQPGFKIGSLPFTYLGVPLFHRIVLKIGIKRNKLDPNCDLSVEQSYEKKRDTNHDLSVEPTLPILNPRTKEKLPQ